jgi:hypothetical protein
MDIVTPAYLSVAAIVWAIASLIVWRDWPRLLEQYSDIWKPLSLAVGMALVITVWAASIALRPLGDTQLISVSGRVVDISEPYRRAGGRRGLSTHVVALDAVLGGEASSLVIKVPARALAKPLGHSIELGRTIDVRMSPTGDVYELVAGDREILSLKAGRQAQGWASRAVAYPATVISVIWLMLAALIGLWRWISPAFAGFMSPSDLPFYVRRSRR